MNYVASHQSVSKANGVSNDVLKRYFCKQARDFGGVKVSSSWEVHCLTERYPIGEKSLESLVTTLWHAIYKMFAGPNSVWQIFSALTNGESPILFFLIGKISSRQTNLVMY